MLVIDKCAALTRAAAKHTPRKGNKNNAENQTERRGGAEPSSLNRLGSAAAFSAVRSFLFIGFAVMVTLNTPKKLITKYCALGSAKFCKNTPHKAEIE